MPPKQFVGVKIMESWMIVVVSVVALIGLIVGGYFLMSGGDDCKYQTRTLVNGSWQCPQGWTDTGADWNLGSEEGAKQCKQC